MLHAGIPVVYSHSCQSCPLPGVDRLDQPGAAPQPCGPTRVTVDSMRRSLVVLAVAGLLALGSCSETDGGAELACRDFARVAEDGRNGLLTDTEMRDRFKDVNDNARLADSDAVKTAANDMLRHATSGDDAELAEAVGRMAAACREV